MLKHLTSPSNLNRFDELIPVIRVQLGGAKSNL
jgi:hypothetical protein